MPDEEPQSPSLTTFEPTGLFSNPIGNVATEQEGGEVFPSTSFEGQDPFGLTKQVGRFLQRGVAEGISDQQGGTEPLIAAQPKLDPETLNKTYGIPGHLKFDSPLAASVAQSMQDAKHDELARQDAAARTPDGFFPKAARLGAGFVAGALDPLNIAAAFTPVIGEARLAAMLGRGAITDLGLGGRIALRGLEGATSGAISQAPLVGLRYGLSQQEQADYSGMDALGDVLMGGALGGILHPLGGAIGDAFRGPTPRVAPERAEALREAGIRPEVAAAQVAPTGITPDEASKLEAINSSPETSEAATKTAISQIAQGNPVDVEPVVFAEPPAEGTPGATPYARPPKEPQGLADFLHANGGIKDVGGDVRSSLGRSMDRPGLINNRDGLALDKATEMAWDAGFFPEHDQRPTINDLLNRLDEDVRGNPQYSSHAEAQQAAFREATDHNSEIDRLSSRTGVDPADKTREQFFDAVTDHMSQSEHLEAIAHAEDAHAAAFSEFERLAREEGHWHPPDQSRSLEDLEHEYRQEATAPAAGDRGGGAGQPGDIGQPAQSGEAGGGSGGRGAGDAGRAIPPDPSDAFDRAAGYANGRMTPEDEALDKAIEAALKRVKPDDPSTVPPQVQTDLEDIGRFFDGADAAGILTMDDRREIDASKTWLDQAKALGKGAVQASACLMRSG